MPRRSGPWQKRGRDARLRITYGKMISSLLLRRLPACILVTMLGMSAGCAYVSAVPVKPGSKVSGIRIYDVKPLLIVNGQTTELAYVPNYNRAYALQFGAFLAKNDFNAKMANGLLTEVTANMDTTAFIGFLIKALDKAVPGTSVSGEGQAAIGGVEDRFQVYDIVFDDDGNLIGLQPLIDQTELLRLKTTKARVGSTATVVPQPGAGGGEDGIQTGPIGQG
jgi:hypothetical protein